MLGLVCYGQKRVSTFIVNEKKILSTTNESIFHLLLHVPMKSQLITFSAIWDALQGQMTSQESQRKPNFSLHETEELIQLLNTFSSCLELETRKWTIKEEQVVQSHAQLAGALGYSEDSRASQIQTMDSSGTRKNVYVQLEYDLFTAHIAIESIVAFLRRW